MNPSSCDYVRSQRRFSPAGPFSCAQDALARGVVLPAVPGSASEHRFGGAARASAASPGSSRPPLHHGGQQDTVNRGLTGVGLDRQPFELWQTCLTTGARLPPDFDQQGLEPPFDVRDREADMRQANAFFVKELGIEEPT